MNIHRLGTGGFLLLLSVILTGQSDTECFFARNLPEEVDCLFDRTGNTSEIVVTKLPFWDVSSKTVVTGGELDAFNQSLDKGLKALHSRYPKYVVNMPGHSLPSDDAQKLIAIYWSLDLSHKEKTATIIQDFMKPHGIDVLIWGQLVQEPGGPVYARLAAVSRSAGRMFGYNHRFAAKDLYCENPERNGEKVLCEKVLEQVEDELGSSRRYSASNPLFQSSKPLRFK